MSGIKEHEDIPFVDELFPIRILWDFKPNRDKVLNDDITVTCVSKLRFLLGRMVRCEE